MKPTKFREDNMRRCEEGGYLANSPETSNSMWYQEKNPTFCHQFMCSVLRWSSMLKKAWNTDNGQPRSSSLSSGYKKVFAAIIYIYIWYSWSWSPCRCSWSCCAPPGRRTGCPRCHGTLDTVLHKVVKSSECFCLVLLDKSCHCH